MPQVYVPLAYMKAISQYLQPYINEKDTGNWFQVQENKLVVASFLYILTRFVHCPSLKPLKISCGMK